MLWTPPCLTPGAEGGVQSRAGPMPDMAPAFPPQSDAIAAGEAISTCITVERIEA